MEYHKENIIKTGIKATSFINQTTSHENNIASFYNTSLFTLIRGQFKALIKISDGAIYENNQHMLLTIFSKAPF